MAFPFTLATLGVKLPLPKLLPRPSAFLLKIFVRTRRVMQLGIKRGQRPML